VNNVVSITVSTAVFVWEWQTVIVSVYFGQYSECCCYLLMCLCGSGENLLSVGKVNSTVSVAVSTDVFVWEWRTVIVSG
jgi:hypothetical protein